MRQTGLIPLKKKLKNLELQVSNVPVHFLFFLYMSVSVISWSAYKMKMCYNLHIYIETWNISPQNNT